MPYTLDLAIGGMIIGILFGIPTGIITALRRNRERATLDEVREQLREFIEGKKYEDDLDRFRKRVRSEAEWCVKRKYRDRVPSGVDVETCAL